MKLTDKSPMPWGKHKGVPMANVPAKYLLWLLSEGKCDWSVKQYIIDNKEVLEKE